ncbi:MAG: hypothetical protein COV99_06005 [Bacteroidetes bacterium CG12_big_fil_rev_8_21_14_0_65_60_17]|nr:MAG: hypothetical protein COV99_06005 [Bacteroidetes bacterium CG12_big_fil_rev_8_21_14_0_65_60_17]
MIHAEGQTAAIRMPVVACLLLAVCLVSAGTARARQAPPPDRPTSFSRLHLGGAASLDIEQWGASEWDQRGAARIQAATPLGLGVLEAGVLGLAYDSRDNQLPDWTAFFVHAGWRATWHAHTHLILGAGLRAGNLLMLFDDKDLVAGQRRESEFSLEPHIRADIRVSRRVALFMEGGFLRTFTEPRIDIVQTSAGLVLDLRMPTWLRSAIE